MSLSSRPANSSSSSSSSSRSLASDSTAICGSNSAILVDKSQELEAGIEAADSEHLLSHSEGSSSADIPLEELTLNDKLYGSSKPWRQRFSRAISCFQLSSWKSGQRGKKGRSCLGCCGRSFKRSRKVRWLVYSIGTFLILLGVVQLMTLALGAFVTFFPKEVEWFVDRWGQPGRPTDPLAHWPTDMLADVTPVACHSHNDYWRRVPLFSALEAGCISVEADVWLFDDDLYVGHTTSSLTVNRTLSNLYINPLLEILSNQNPTTHFHPSLDTPPNGVFDTDPSQSLVLLVDFKAKGKAIWPYLIRQLSPLRDRGYLTHFNGTSIIQRPITVVATGDAPFDLVVANRNYRDVFFDAPLGDLTGFGKGHAATSAPHLVDDDDEELDLDGIHLSASGFRPSRISLRMGNSKSKLDTQKKPAPDPAIYDQSNSFYASVSFKRSIGFPWGFHLSSNQLETIRAQVNAAHARGLKVRYWSIPSWPRSLRNHLWAALVREGVDILNVDDLRAATRQDWFKLVKKR